MLDEYLNLPTYPVRSFHHFLIEHLGPVIDNSHTTWHTISPSNDPAWSTAYDALIDAAGGIDLAIVGIGQNGHIGFNEPGAHPSWRSHVVTLEASTLDVNFPETSPDQRPTTALTMGMADLIAARRVLLLASGANKAAVLRTLLEGIDDPHIPATFLRDHPNLTVIADGAALASV
jgi:glucosamine-6-phosphate deaminase